MRRIVKVQVEVGGAAAFTAPVEQDVRAFLQLHFDVVVDLLRSTRPCGVVIPFFAINPDVRVVIVRGRHDRCHRTRCIDNDNGVGFNVIHRTAAVHVVSIRRIDFKNGPRAGATVVIAPDDIGSLREEQPFQRGEGSIGDDTAGAFIHEINEGRDSESAVVFVVTVGSVPLGNPRFNVGVVFVKSGFCWVFQVRVFGERAA